MRDMGVSDLRAIRGRLLSFVSEPAGPGDRDSYRYIEDGIVVVRDGRIERWGRLRSWRRRCRPVLRWTTIPMD